VIRRAAAGVAFLAALAIAASAASAGGDAKLTVYAASSLTNVLPQIDHGERYSFAGSDTLAAQLEQGAPADVIAAANMSIPEELYARHLVTKPVVLTRNALVLVVPRANPGQIRRVADLRRHGVKLVVAAPTVPVGKYTLQVLSKLRLDSVLQNVVSRETDVRGVLAKVALGEADAGFVYATDARTVPGRVRVIRLPARGQPNVRYGIAVVRASRHAGAARAYVAKLLAPQAQRKLQAAGFLAR
jgi:molybdate transport system substrate-binding protein